MSISTYGSSPIKRPRRTRADIERIKDVVVDLLRREHPMTIRQLYYRLVSLGTIAKTEAEYKSTVVRLLGEMRREGDIPFHWIADNTRWMRKPRTHSGLNEALRQTAATYRRSVWDDQDAYVEIWLEKDALAGVLWDVTAPWDVPLMVTRGFASLSFLHSAAEAIQVQYKPTFVYYFGDHDPSGLAITEKVEQDIRGFAPDVDLTVERIAVTPEQIEAINLPTRPTKTSDSRSKSFIGGSVEVDAIPPATLRQLVEASITQHIDSDTHERLLATEQAERETLQSIAERGDCMNTPPKFVPQPTPEAVVQWLRPMVEPGSIVELRILGHVDNPKYPASVWAGYFDTDHLDNLAKIALANTKKSEGVYVTIRPLVPDMLSLANNQVKRKPKTTATDEHVIRRVGLVFDADPKRKPSGISSTDQEKALAWERIIALRDDLDARGFPAPILADSGNGYHLRYRVDLPADDGGLIERVSKAVDHLHSDDRVEMDPKLFNASRIIKLYGTMSRKGDSTTNRPHRWNCVLEGPTTREDFHEVPRELLEELANEAPAPAPAPPVDRGKPGWPITFGQGASPVDRARAYIFSDGFPDAIDGENGHGRLYHVAFVLVDQFGLSESDAYQELARWNEAKARPPESENQIRHKLASAMKKHPTPSLGLLNAPRPNGTPPAHPETRNGKPNSSYPRLEPDQCVMADDRPGEAPNFGYVVKDLGDLASVRFLPDTEHERVVTIHKSDLRNQDGTPLADGPVGWPALRLHTPPPAPPFPVDAFPLPLQDYCREAAAALSAPIDFIGAPMLALAGSAIGQSVNIQVKAGWTEAPLLYVLIVARPGRTKSPAISTVRRPLAAIDHRLRKESEAARKAWLEAKEAHKRDPENNPPPGEEPPQLRAIVKDITRESLVIVLKDNSRGVLDDPDEATAWVARFNEYKSQGADRQFWLSNWSCDPVSVDRKGGRESTYVPHPFIGVLGGIQPAMLGRLSEEGGRDDGFLDRILFAFPDDEAFPRQRWSEATVSEAAALAWSEVIERLHAVEMLHDPETEECRPHLVTFTPKAKAAWVAWYDAHEAETEAPDLAERHGGAWSKMRSHAARFALILARMRQASDPTGPTGPGPIDLADVQGAVKLVDYLKGHLLKTAHQASGGLANPDARAIVQWIKRRHHPSKPLTMFREADVSTDLRRFRSDPATLANALKELLKVGAIRPHQEPPPEGPGHPPSPAWDVHPELLERAPENPGNPENAASARPFPGYSGFSGRDADNEEQREVMEL